MAKIDKLGCDLATPINSRRSMHDKINELVGGLNDLSDTVASLPAGGSTGGGSSGGPCGVMVAKTILQVAYIEENSPSAGLITFTFQGTPYSHTLQEFEEAYTNRTPVILQLEMVADETMMRYPIGIILATGGLFCFPAFATREEEGLIFSYSSPFLPNTDILLGVGPDFFSVFFQVETQMME